MDECDELYVVIISGLLIFWEMDKSKVNNFNFLLIFFEL